MISRNYNNNIILIHGKRVFSRRAATGIKQGPVLATLLHKKELYKIS